MGLRDVLAKTLGLDELHGCAPYSVQPCNLEPQHATGAATPAQLSRALPRHDGATGDATPSQPVVAASVRTSSRVQLPGLTQDEIDKAHLEPWTDAQVDRFQVRFGLFSEAGFVEAETLAMRLHVRDVTADGRVVCAECAYLRGGDRWRCLNAEKAGVGYALPLEMLTLMQRCPGVDVLVGGGGNG